PRFSLMVSFDEQAAVRAKMAISSRCFTCMAACVPVTAGCLAQGRPVMMSAPARRDKDAVFKHKRVAETKGSTPTAGKGRFDRMSGRGARTNRPESQGRKRGQW